MGGQSDHQRGSLSPGETIDVNYLKNFLIINNKIINFLFETCYEQYINQPGIPEPYFWPFSGSGAAFLEGFAAFLVSLALVLTFFGGASSGAAGALWSSSAGAFFFLAAFASGLGSRFFAGAWPSFLTQKSPID